MQATPARAVITNPKMSVATSATWMDRRSGLKRAGSTNGTAPIGAKAVVGVDGSDEYTRGPLPLRSSE